MKHDKKAFIDKNSNNKLPVKKTAKPEITEWFFMSAAEITAKDLWDFLKPLKLGELDLWEEMDILTLETSDKTSIDFEGMKKSFPDEKDRQFVKENGYSAVYSVSVSGDFPDLRILFEKILTQFQGGFYADTEDFKPSILSRR